MAKSGEFSKEELKGYNILNDEDKINFPEETKDTSTDFTRILKILLDLCFLMFVNYLVTFIVFPGVSIQGKLL